MMEVLFHIFLLYLIYKALNTKQANVAFQSFLLFLARLKVKPH